MNTVRRFTWTSASRTHVGMVRKINEDACLDIPERGLWAVADGMGGHEAGDLASRMIVEALGLLPLDDVLTVATVENTLRQVNDQLRQEAAKRYGRGTIGSTVVVLLVNADRATIMWVGDSRVYRFRDDQLEKMTRDHSHVQDLVDQGLLSAAEAERHPMANVITRAVGAAEDLEIDQLEFPLRSGDMFLLCSDGLTKTISDAEIAQLLSHGDSLDVVKTLIHTALVRNANDNVTTVVVKVHGGEAMDSEPTIPSRRDDGGD